MMRCQCKTYPCPMCGKRNEAQKHYYIKFSGAAWDVIADTPEQAWKQIQDILVVYCTPTIKEIGVECDENGYDLPCNTQSKSSSPTVSQSEHKTTT